MQKHYLPIPSRESIVSARSFCYANRFGGRLSLILFLFLPIFQMQAQCPSPPGDPSVFGTSGWNAYGYDHSDLSLATAVYSGYYTQATLGFDTRSGSNSWSQGTSPASSAGWSGCSLDEESFTVVYKRKGFPCGNYALAMTSWDDAAVVYIDGVQQWFCAEHNQENGCSGNIGTLMLNEDTEIEVRIAENGGDAYASLSIVAIAEDAGTLSTTGSTTICANTRPAAITLSGYTGDIVKWQSAADAAFTSGVSDIAITSAVLSPAAIGPLTASTYIRAVVQTGTCTPVYAAPILFTVPAAVTYSDGEFDGIVTATTPLNIEDDLLLEWDLNVCSCHVKNGKTLTVVSGNSLTVVTSVTVDSGAQLVINDSASLVQLDDSAVNSGSVEVKRNSQPMKTYDYTYWSSPVQGNTLYQLSPLTAGDKYYRFDPVNNGWVSILYGAQAMEAGKGYIVRAPQGWAVDNASSGVYSAAFNGTPNNGVIPATIEKGAGTFNLIGNPYPSAIDVDAFLTDPANTGIINGTVYLWTHNTAISAAIPGNAILNYTADDYAKYNLTGGVRTATSAATGGTLPLGIIASGQGFFIEAATGLANGSYTVNFNNSMRIVGDNNNFYRTSQPGTATPALEKNRLWVIISNTEGAYNQTLIGYITNATNGPDALFDGKPWATANVVSLYSVNGADTYSIQGRALPFSAADVVPLGYRTTIAGNFTLSLEDFDGLFQSQNIYLLDKSNNMIQDLKAGSYSFSSATGTFNDRFEIHYTNSSLGIHHNGEASFTAYAADGRINVNASGEIKSLAVFDIVGREVFRSGTIAAAAFQTQPLNLQQQALIVKATLEDGSVISRKVLLR